jgi:hypothetical protein
MTFVLNEFMRVRLAEPLVCDLLLEGRSYKLPDIRCLPVLASVDQATDLEELTSRFARALTVEHDEAERLVDQLVAAGILRPSGSEHPLMPQVRRWEHYGWTDALIFHCLTEQRPYHDVLGAAEPHDPGVLLRERLDHRAAPPFWKKLDTDYQPLPPPAPDPDRDLAEVLLARRTHVPWSGERMSAAQVSRVLHDANVPLVELRRRAEATYRDRPSVLLENTYGDLETYLIAYDVDGIEPGVYHYDPRDHGIGAVAQGDFRERVQRAFVGQQRASSGACSLLVSVVWERHMFRYPNDPRAYRTVLTLIGQLAQRYLVAFTAQRFTTFPTPAHQPGLTDELIGTRRFVESGIYLITAG